MNILSTLLRPWLEAGVLDSAAFALLVCGTAISTWLERGRAEPGWRRRFAAGFPVLTVGFAVCFFLKGVWHAWAFSTDDAFISLRYASNFAHGAGLGFNPDESPPVEGYSNFLYVVLAAAGIRLGLNPIVLLKVVSVASSVVGMVVTHRLMRPLVGRSLSAFAVLYLSRYYGLIWWSVSGLETGFFMATVVVSVLLVMPSLAPDGAKRSIRRAATAGLVAALGALSRPEGAVVGMMLLAILMGRRIWGRGDDVRNSSLSKDGAFAFFLAFSVPVSVYVGWRFGYYGRVLPNTVYCKADWVWNPWALLEALYSRNTALLAAALVGIWRIKDPRTWPLFAIPAAYAVLLYGVDPIIGHETRHFVGSLPLLVGAGMVGMAVLVTAESLAAIPVLVCLGAWLALSVSPPSYDEMGSRAEKYASRSEVRRGIAKELDLVGKPGGSVLLGDAGVIPFFSSLKFIDAYCLNSRVMTTPEVDRDPDKFADHVLSRERPEFIVISNRSETRLLPSLYMGTWPSVITHPEFKSKYEFAWRTEGPRFSRYWIYRRKQGADGTSSTFVHETNSGGEE